MLRAISIYFIHHLSTKPKLSVPHTNIFSVYLDASGSQLFNFDRDNHKPLILATPRKLTYS